jgi:hypothetical protein
MTRGIQQRKPLEAKSSPLYLYSFFIKIKLWMRKFLDYYHFFSNKRLMMGIASWVDISIRRSSMDQLINPIKQLLG